MRTKLNLQGSSNARVANKLGMSSLPRLPLSPISMSSMPLEWLDAGSWRLPSGQALAEFALQAGFLAPLLLKTGAFGEGTRSADEGPAGDKVLPRGTKPLGKGSER
jgi:hypothetical protein